MKTKESSLFYTLENPRIKCFGLSSSIGLKRKGFVSKKLIFNFKFRGTKSLGTLRHEISSYYLTHSDL